MAIFYSYVSHYQRVSCAAKLRVRLAGSKRVLDSSACQICWSPSRRIPNPWNPPWNRWRIHLLSLSSYLSYLGRKKCHYFLDHFKAPRCSKYGKANGNNHPQNHLYGLYKPSPNGTSMALGLPGNTTLPQQWQLDLLVDRCALAHREHIMISHQRGPGRCQISTRHLGISQWHHSIHTLSSLYPDMIWFL